MKEIAIIRLSSIGDVLHCTPVARTIKNEWPNCRITWLVGETAAEVLIGNPHIDNIMIWSRERFEAYLRAYEFKLAFEMWRSLRRKLAKMPFDAVLDIHGLFLSGAITSQTRGARRIGLSGTKEFNALFMDETAEPLGGHITEKYLGVLKPLGITHVDNRMTLVVPDAAKQFAGRLLEKNDAHRKRVLVLIPGTTWPSKNWPAEHFAKAARLLSQHFTIVLCGGKREWARGLEIQAKAGVPIINAIGKTGLMQMAGLLEHAAAVVTGDTGPLYMAAALGIPTVAIFGPTNPQVYAPLGVKSAVLTSRAHCSFCHKMVCPHGTGVCMSGVRPEEVAQKVLNLAKPCRDLFSGGQ